MTSIFRKSMAAMMALALSTAVFGVAAPAVFAEGTPEEVVNDDDDEVPDDSVEDEIPGDDEEPAPAPATGDSAAPLALAIASTAVVAAAGMTFVLKKSANR